MAPGFRQPRRLSVVFAGRSGNAAHAHEGELADALGLGEDGFLWSRLVEIQSVVSL